MSETKVLFVGGGEVRIHEDMESVRSRLASGNGDWIVLDRGGTEHRPICVNPATILSGAVEELKAPLSAGEYFQPDQ